MSGREERARQLQNRRKKGGMPALETESGEAIEMGATSTIAAIVFLLSVGASLATSYFLMRNPGCWVGTSSNSAIASASLRAPASSPAQIVMAKQVSPIPPKPTPTQPLAPVSITKCSADEMSILSKQLPRNGCYDSPVGQACSFTKATAKGTFHDTTTYYRSVVAQMTFENGFTALFTTLTGVDDEPMDLLMVASHDAEKYNVAKWRQVASVTSPAKPPVPMAATKNKAQVLVAESEIAKALQAKSWKASTGMTDADMKGESTMLTASGQGGTKTLNEWTQKNAPGHIHYLRLGIDNSPGVMAGGAGAGGALERAWYLEFGYDWKGDWSSASLEKVITETLGSFACYWQGGDGNLWRITGCWQTHYNQKHWSFVSCVNARIPEAQPIYNKMEEQFQVTLKKQLNFG